MSITQKRPSLRTGAAFLFLLAAGCASVEPYEKAELVQVLVGTQPAEAETPAKVAETGGPKLRVLLRRGQQGLKLSAPGGLALYDSQDGHALVAIGAAGRGRLEASGESLRMGDRALGTEAEVRADTQGLKVAGRRYGGRVLLRASGGQVLLINEISLQDYLKGVLPSEVPATWPLEALKAQALAARSYAVWRASETRKSGNGSFDLDDSVSSQAYQGLEKQDPRTDQAVDATNGEILAFQGKIAECFFHSNSGGHTAGSDEAWGGKSSPAYLNGVMDIWSEDQKHYAWSATLELEQVETRLNKAGLFSGLLEEVVPKEQTDSGRWELVRLIGSNGEKLIKATAFRSALGADILRSTNFRVRRHGSSIIFDGLGWGHGVGLAQEGAKAMAEAGRGYRNILSFYYPGTRWARLK
jgi:stage II sporulation protein D